jgi:iron complex outermembrane receptor protein
LIDPTQKYLARTRQNKFTQEVRISTPKDWFLHFTVGAFYQRQKSENNGDYHIDGLRNAYTLATPTNPNSARTYRAVKRDAFYLTENDTIYKDYAIFAEGTIDVTDTLMLTGGIRGFKTDNLTYGFAGTRGSALFLMRAYDVVNNRAGCTHTFLRDRILCELVTHLPIKPQFFGVKVSQRF